MELITVISCFKNKFITFMYVCMYVCMYVSGQNIAKKQSTVERNCVITYKKVSRFLNFSYKLICG